MNLNLPAFSGIRKRLQLFLHKGNRYTCPFCSYSSKDLSMIGLDFPVLTERQVVGGGLRHGGCYNCGSTDRERLLFIYLREELNLFNGTKDKSILHIAPENNLSNQLIRAGFTNYICGDLFTPGYNYPDYVRNINLLNIPYPDKTFDLVICNHVLEHIPEDKKAMKEILRVLKPGAKAILQVPLSKSSHETFEDFSITDPKQREKAFGQSDHVRIYGQVYPQRLEECGFIVNRINISEKYRQYGLNIDEDLFICEKGVQELFFY